MTLTLTNMFSNEATKLATAQTILASEKKISTKKITLVTVFNSNVIRKQQVTVTAKIDFTLATCIASAESLSFNISQAYALSERCDFNVSQARMTEHIKDNIAKEKLCLTVDSNNVVSFDQQYKDFVTRAVDAVAYKSMLAVHASKLFALCDSRIQTVDDKLHTQAIKMNKSFNADSKKVAVNA